MKPYYQDSHCTIYHGDCREILPQLPKVDLVLTDPPYGIGYDARGGGSKSGVGMRVPRRVYQTPTVIGDEVDFDPEFLWSLGKRRIIWGAEHFHRRLPALGALQIWVKRETPADSDLQFSDAETAFDTGAKLTRVLNHKHNGFMCDLGDLDRVHPTQKPLAVIAWSLSFAKDCLLVLDPFMGSGTTLRAAKDLGRQAIGIELEERYCEIAALRLAQECLPLDGALRTATPYQQQSDLITQS